VKVWIWLEENGLVVIVEAIFDVYPGPGILLYINLNLSDLGDDLLAEGERRYC
jgi:hypothetical protein